MKKLLTLIAMVAFSSSVFADTGDNSVSSLFDSQQASNVTVLSQKELSEIKGGARSPVYTCSVCGAKHGGVYSPNVCYN